MKNENCIEIWEENKSLNWVSFRNDEIRSKSFYGYYDKVAINFLLTELIKIDQLFLYYYRQSLGVSFDW